MRIFKSSALVCAGFLCVGVSVQAQDNAAQAAARAALMQKMQEMDQPGNDNGTTSSFSNVPNDVPRQTTRPQNRTVIVQTPAPVSTLPADSSAIPPLSRNSAPSQAYTPNQDNDAQTTARAALLQRMRELDVQDMNTESMNASSQVNPATGLGPDMTAPQAVTNSRPRLPEPFFEPAPQITETPQQQMQRQQRPAKKRTFVPFQSQRAPIIPVDNHGFAPVQPPAAPVSQDKEIALHALLAKYRADQLSPAEYQAERARILSEP